jgi:hypothetical protein
MIGTLGQFVREIRDLLTGSGDPIPVDIGTNIDVTIDNTSIEISNDVGNPIPITDGGGSVTVDGPVTDAQLRASAIPISDAGNSLTVDATSWPLPAGAATGANQSTIIGHVDGIEGLLTAIDTDTSSIDGKLPVLSGGRIPVDIGAISFGDVEIKNDSGNPIPTSVAARTPTTMSVASSATSVTVLAANVNRKGISIANDSTSALRLSYATPATLSNAFIVMAPNSFLLLDQQLIVGNAIYGIWSAVNGTAQVTEYI